MLLERHEDKASWDFEHCPSSEKLRIIINKLAVLTVDPS